MKKQGRLVNLTHSIKRLGKQLFVYIEKAQLLMVASHLAYTTILSLIPMLALSFSIFNFLGGTLNVYESIKPIILANLAEGAGEQLLVILEKFLQNTNNKALGIGSLIGLLITSISLFSSIEKAIISISLGNNFKLGDYRKWYKRWATYILFLSLGPIGLSIFVGISGNLIASKEIPFRAVLPSGTVFILAGIAVLFIVYKFTPIGKVKTKAAFISAIVGALSLNFARFLYSVYITKMSSYGSVYGSLSAFPVLLLWIYIVWVIVLLGAALTMTLNKNWKEE